MWIMVSILNTDELNLSYLKNLWDEPASHAYGTDDVALLLYRSNLLGSDLRITNFAGGNTSCKQQEVDPLTGERVEILWVKGSGGDIGTLKKAGLASLYMDKLRALKKLYKGIQFEDEMVPLLKHCVFNLNTTAPSIDTPLHAFIPYRHIDHLHPDSIIAIAASKEGRAITQDIFNEMVAWIDWQRPGFDLGLKLEETLHNNPGIRGIVLGGHGLINWGTTSYECYCNSLDLIDTATKFLEGEYGKRKPVFGGIRIKELAQNERHKKAAAVMPLVRGLCSGQNRMIGHFTDDERVLEFVNSKDLEALAARGTSCPDHFLRTKIRPLILPVDAGSDLGQTSSIKEQIENEFVSYREYYRSYYDRCKGADSPPMRDPNPVIILWPHVGMFTFAKDKQTARVASEFYINAINVMKGAEAVSEYIGLSEQEAFNIEYWALEEAKLKRMPPEKPLSRKIAIITGGGGGIGSSIAEKFLEEGACVVVTDNREERVQEVYDALSKRFKKDVVRACVMDVTSDQSVMDAYTRTVLAFGGVDIVVHSAGLAISKPIADTTSEEWDLLYNVMVRGQFLLAREGSKIMQTQQMGGDIVNIVSKNALVSGPKNIAYGSAKAAQLHMSRLMAAELGSHKIRVNVVNPDAVIRGSKIWHDGWAEARAKAYGISLDELPAYYAKRTVLNEEVLPDDIAQAVFTFVSGQLKKSTGNLLNVDAGITESFPR
jgi:rhamnulose-1-phosphate aldolase/alcohol dehydrogenase